MQTHRVVCGQCGKRIQRKRLSEHLSHHNKAVVPAANKQLVSRENKHR